LGKFLTKILFIIYPIYFIFTAGVTLRDQTELIQLFLIDQASLYILGTVLMIVVFYGINLSMEVVGRTNEMFFFIHIFSFIIFTFMIIMFNKANLESLIPVFDEGIKPLLIDSLKFSYAVPAGELFVFILIYQFLNDKKGAAKIPFLSILVSGFMFLVITILCILYIEPESNIIDYSPAIKVSRTIDYRLFFQRFDLLLICLFVLHTFIKLSILIYASKYLLGNVFKIKKDYFITIFFCIIIVILSVNVVKNYNDLVRFREKMIFSYIRLAFEIIIPFSLVFLSFIRKPKEQQKESQDTKDKKNKDKDQKDDNKNKKDKNIITNLKNKFKEKVLKKS
ncbi:MAG: spore gernimation protein, partial [Haloplasmataceae bacterium]|nr:spore gernimation protein [Haloplasmataceae bacterium]